jgi:hypothetical protein
MTDTIEAPTSAVQPVLVPVELPEGYENLLLFVNTAGQTAELRAYKPGDDAEGTSILWSSPPEGDSDSYGEEEWRAYLATLSSFCWAACRALGLPFDVIDSDNGSPAGILEGV